MPSSRRSANHIEYMVSALDTDVSRKGARLYYPSNCVGGPAVNGVTGLPYGFKAGSIECRALFKVMDTRGNVDENGRHARCVRADPNTLYFDSPTEYETYAGVQLPETIHDAWDAR